MSKYNKISLESLNSLCILAEKESFPFGDFTNKKLLKELVNDGVVLLSTSTPKIIKVLSQQLLFRYIRKANSLKVNDIDGLRSYLDFESKTKVKSKDEIALHKETSKDDISESFYGIHIAVLKSTDVIQDDKIITLEPMKSGSYFFFQKNMITIPADTVVVGIENPQVLWLIERYQHLFVDYEKVVFVLINDYKCGYIYSHWLKTIRGKYIHFGDFDLAGISIYHDKVLPKIKSPQLAEFFLPNFVFPLLVKKGNARDFDNQIEYLDGLKKINNKRLKGLICHIEHHEKSLEQEFLSILHIDSYLNLEV